MTAHLHTIDHAVQITLEWGRQLSKLLDWKDELRTLRVMRGTLQPLRGWPLAS